MPFDSVALAVGEIVSLLDSTPSFRHSVFKGRDNFSYNIASELDYPHIVSLPDLLTADVTGPGAGEGLLFAIDVLLDGFCVNHFEGRWEESLTESLSVTVRRLSAPEIGIYRVSCPLEDYALKFSGAGFYR